MTDHPPLGLVDVYAATIPSVAFGPGVHVNYAETVLPMKDGLPKLKDFPAELGGSGIAVPEKNVSSPPPSHGEGGPEGRRGKAAVEIAASFRSEISQDLLCGLPPPPRRGHLPRKTGEA